MVRAADRADETPGDVSTKSLLTYSARENRMLVLAALFLIVAVTVATSVFARQDPHATLLADLVNDIIPKLAVVAVPLIVLLKSAVHSRWETLGGSTRARSTVLVNALYLELFIASLVGLPALALAWAAAQLAGPSLIDASYGIVVAAGGLCMMWTMTGLVYTLEFTKLGDNSETLTAVCIFVSLGFAVGLTQLFHAVEFHPALTAALLVLAGLAVLLICRRLSVGLYNKRFSGGASP